MLLASTALRAQGQDSLPVNTKRLWIGLEIPSTIAHPAAGGYSFQPMLVLNLSRYATIWAGGGLVKATRDTLFNNLYDYSSEGWYVKGGGDINLNFKREANSGFRLGGGLSLSDFTEKGVVQFQYPSRMDGWRPGNQYQENVENHTWAAAFEFRQGLFADLGKIAIQLHVQESIILRRPQNPVYPAHYVPGMGGYMPRPFLSGGTVPRRIIPGAYFYLFYRLY
ncbi:hypothetical protein D770_21730 [Flammeovirgaceae bacterium 311]|nr:hypothetical protein D770_21730 [Flammeovirgaceae bacterium 311]